MIDTIAPKPKDLTGKRFGRLTVISFSGISKGHYRWLCHCDCGQERIVQSGNLKGNHTTSCGCWQREVTKKRDSHPRTHGLSNHRISTIYNMMKDRCYNSKNIGYMGYGGRGITVCERWRNSFDNFVKDMGMPTSSLHQLERIDNDGDYTPDNCRWATVKEQARNRRTNHIIEYDGNAFPIAVWAEMFGMSHGTLSYRIEAGWPIEKALKSPVRPYQKQ